MEDKISRIGALMMIHLKDELDEQELKELQEWIAVSEENRRQYIEVKAWIEKFGHYHVDQESIDASWQKIMSQMALTAMPEEKKVRRLKWWTVAVAAVIAGVVAGIYIFKTPAPKNEIVNNGTTPVEDISPGGNKATLTLSDGTTIVLDSVQNGNLALQGNTQVTKQDGQLLYSTTQRQPDAGLDNNVLRTPLKAVYNVTLSDGTKVTLNSVSRLSYPVSFTGDSREVEITGEAYFEVAKDATKPFRVSILSASGQKLGQVEVLGTEFNIMNYADEDKVKTTLVEGSVKMISGSQSLTLVPGKQALFAKDNPGTLRVQDADTELETAWRNGYFIFDGADIKTIARQLARWYDIEIEYQNNIPDLDLKGKVPRNVNLSDVMEALEYTGVHYQLQGRKLILMP